MAAAHTDVVHIEGIEDIDLHAPQASEAVQVKYLAGQKYASPKSLREPIRLMLDHYKTGARWNYVLYIHFSDFGNMPDRLDVAQVKQSLTKKTRDEGTVEYFVGVHDADLEDFCSRLRIIRGDAFETQETALIDALRVAMDCDGDEVLAIYIAKVREFIHERARSDDPSVRTVTRHELIDSLTVKDFLFDKWQMQKIGADRYLAAQKRKLRSSNFHDPTKKRAVYLEICENSLDETVRLCEALAGKQLGRLKSAHPWTVIVEGAPDIVRRLKVGLVRSDIAFNDGHEDLEFQSQAFTEPPIINTRGAGDKIQRSSFVLRLVTQKSFRVLTPTQFKISRLVSIGDEQAWMNGAADQVITLRHFEPAAYRQLMEEIA
ncbi:hypothetical protein [Dietzia sp. Alg238-R159]|uniref:hypothetical protein n=1 Tax=Dietzia sp. Alg238-R159 TaxID=2305986 RepID=UPI0013D7BB37|nr:hypothetical protein [Dietzia sp. Alg238-R159]